MKRKNTMLCNPGPPPAVLPENRKILHHMHGGLTVKSASTCSKSSQLLFAALCHNIKEQAEHQFKLPEKYNRARGRGGMCICLQDEEGGWVCHGKMEALWRKPE